MRWSSASGTIHGAVVAVAWILALSGSRVGVRTATTSTLVPGRVQIQKPGIAQTEQDKQRADQVKQAFTKAFDEYMQFGFPADEVRPLSKNGRDTRNGWSATLVDSLDTLFVMDLQDRFTQGVAATLKIDFSRSRTHEVSGPSKSMMEHAPG